MKVLLASTAILILLPYQSLAQVAGPAARNGCFVRVQALRAMPGLSAALEKGQAVNLATGSARLPEALKAYDRSLAEGIASWGNSAEVAMRLLDVESLVDRIGECSRQIQIDLATVNSAAAALEDGFRRNVDHYSLADPNLSETDPRRRLYIRTLSSGRLANALAKLGRSSEREAALQRERQLLAQAAAEAEARWEAGRAQREAEERARWAAANAEERRQLSVAATPDQKLVLRAIMGEFREVGQIMSSLTFARAISELTDRPGSRSGFNEYWNLDSGDATLSFGTGEYAMVQSYRFSIANVDCRRLRAQPPAFTCDLTAQTSVEVVMAGGQVMNTRSNEVRISTPIEWNGSRWSAPRVRAAMRRGVTGAAIAPVSRNSTDPNAALCKSLYAGVVAVGGSSTSPGLNPQTWGC